MLKFLLVSALSTVLSFTPISWGLGGFGNDRVPTAPNGATKLLDQYNGIYYMPMNDRKIYLTFDLGYEAGYTNEILDILREHNLHAVFFLCGNYLTQTELINRMINEGHTIGNHTDKHKDLPTLTPDAVTHDIMTFQNNFTTQYPHAKAPTTFRPPKGRIDEKTLRIAHENGLKTVMWSIAIKDWGDTPIDHVASANKIANRLHPGAIILLHITNQGMPKTLQELLPLIAKRGYTIGSPNEYIETKAN